MLRFELFECVEQLTATNRNNYCLKGEKVTLGINILLSLVVFLLLVSKILPPTSLVLPLIAKYLLFTFIMNCISILVTVIIINWNFRGPRTHKMPNWIRVVFLNYLPVLLFMRRPKRTRLRWMLDMPSLGAHYHPYHQHAQHGLSVDAKHCKDKSKLDFVELADVTIGANVQSVHTHHPNCTVAAHQKQPKIDARDNESVDVLYLSPEAYKATEAIEFIAEHLRSEDEYIQIREDWKYVAMVIDRLQLYIFFLVTAGGTMAILLNAPHIFEFVDQDEVIKLHSS
ncbi:Acetylcholine receptor subunit beta-like 1 [Leptotrombidium deliense]|uniref:Acetylcholine receptor subunit beta-like 1 n=1 Tax=Leptotrombidium deliense TaxID=299467 RepID=A0A443SMJ0_9ACAR|nr:Acetylcholine receptor subunit beta-like 1 [Leptotrombidium deliense]